MQLSKEMIINAFKRQGMLYKTMKGDVRHVIHEHDFERAAEQILKELQPNIEPQPQLQQTTCYVQLTPLLCHYDAWCKETKRNGGVLIGSSIREFIEYLEA